MKALRMIAVTTAFFVFSVQAQDRFLSRETLERYLKPTIPAPKGCPLGVEVPILATFGPDGTTEKAGLWKQARSSWLFQKSAEQIVKLAVQYVRAAKLLIPGNREKMSVVIYVPCEHGGEASP